MEGEVGAVLRLCAYGRGVGGQRGESIALIIRGGEGENVCWLTWVVLDCSGAEVCRQRLPFEDSVLRNCECVSERTGHAQVFFRRLHGRERSC